MKKYILLIINGLLLLFQVSCLEKVSFEQKSYTPYPVLNAELRADSSFKIFLSTSKSTTETLEIDFIEDANVYISTENDTIHLTYSTSQKCYTTDLRAKAGATYACRAEYQNTQIHAITTVPEKPKLDTVFLKSMPDEFGHTRTFINITFIDNPIPENFYILTIKSYQPVINDDLFNGVTDTVWMYSNSFISTRNSIVEFYKYYETLEFASVFSDPSDYFNNEPNYKTITGHAFIFSDSQFSGQSAGFQILPEGDFSPEKPLVVELTTISKELYEYYKSLSYFYLADDDPFAEPINVYSNVSNGIGIFGASATDTVQCIYLL